MSISSSDRSNRTVVRLAGARERRNGHPATAFDVSLGESDRRPRAVPELPQESLDDRDWDDRVAREVRHQEVIEASFDRSEAYARVGDFEEALEWLDRAARLSGGLPGTYRARRARWVSSPAMRLRATRGYQDAGSAGCRTDR
jgi:hypothetical protein